MNILRFHTEEELDQTGANIITSMVQLNPRTVLGLATGGTPIGIYRELVKQYRRGLVSYRHTYVYSLDEYIGLPADHPQSYNYYLQEHFIRHVDIPEDHVFFPDGMAPSVEEECRRYDRKLFEIGPADIQIVGIGLNGHIGFNEPGEQLRSTTHRVRLAPSTIQANKRFFDKEEQVPREAITMGIGQILRARHILLVIKGKNKAEIARKALTGPITTQCPASLLQAHPHVTVLMDDEAGAWL